MKSRAHAPGARLGLLLAAAALLPGVFALIAVGPGDAPSSALAITEAAGVFSMVAIQGLERRAADPGPPVADASHLELDPTPMAADLPLEDATEPLYEPSSARVLPLRL
jgi:hypothetical protein